MSIVRIAEPAADKPAAGLGEFLSPASFWLPEPAWPSAWAPHAPFAFWLTEALAPRVLVGLGVGDGVSYLAFCQAIHRLGAPCRAYAVMAGGAGPLRDRHDARDGGFSSLVQGGTEAAAARIDDGSVDLLHLDGGRTEAALRHDLQTWWPKLSDRAVVLLHGINGDDGTPGRLCDELRLRHPGFAFSHGEGLGVLGVGARLPGRVARLLDAAPEPAHAIREAYARLGAAVAAQAARTDAGSQAAELDRLRSGLADRADHVRRLAAEMLTLKANAGRAFTELARRRADSENTAATLAENRAEIVRLADDAHAAARRIADLDATVRALRHDRAVILASTSWRVTAPLRAAVGAARAVPRPARRILRGLAAMARPGADPYRGPAGRLRLRRDRAILAASPLFDAGWYLARFPDVAASGVDPARHYLRHGAAEGRDPGPGFGTGFYLARYEDVRAAGVNPLLHYLRVGRAEGRTLAAPAAPTAPAAAAPPAPPAPLHLFAAPGAARRVTLLLDDAEAAGREDAAVILAAVLAQTAGAGLRIVARSGVADAGAVRPVLLGAAIGWDDNIGCITADRPIPLATGELFLTTAWQSLAAIGGAIDPRRLALVLDADPRLACADAPARLACEEALATPGLRVAVQSRPLFDHLCDTMPAGLAARACWFEPAFPDAARPAPDAPPRRPLCMVDARTRDPELLGGRVLQALAAAIEAGAITAADWDVALLLDEAGDPSLPGGVVPVALRDLGSPAAMDAVRAADLGVALCYAPQPGRLPLLLAAQGAAVVTSRYGRKTSLHQYSDAIACEEPTVAALVAAIGRAAEPSARRARAAAGPAGGIARDWRTALAPALAFLAGT